MFDDLDKLDKIKDKDINPKEDRGINLLPPDLKRSKKIKRPPDKFKLAKKDLHLVAKEPQKSPFAKSDFKPHQPKAKGFSLAKMFSFLKRKPQSAKVTEPTILSMNLVKGKSHPPPLVDKKVQPPSSPQPKPPQPEPAKLDPSKPLRPASAAGRSPYQPADQAHGIAYSQAKPVDAYKDNKKDGELDVNLLPKRKHQLTDGQKITSYIMIVIIGILVVVSPYIFYQSNNTRYQNENTVLKQQLEFIDQRNKETKEQIKDLGPLSNKLAQLLPLFGSHTYWSKFFPTLERHTAKNVYFISLDVNPNDLVSLHGRALDLRDVAEQLIAFQNNQDYLDVQLQSINIVEIELPFEPKIEFSVGFKLASSVIHPDQD